MLASSKSNLEPYKSNVIPIQSFGINLTKRFSIFYYDVDKFWGIIYLKPVNSP